MKALLFAMVLGVTALQAGSITVGKGKKFHAYGFPNLTLCGRTNVNGGTFTNTPDCKLCLRKIAKQLTKKSQ